MLLPAEYISSRSAFANSLATLVSKYYKTPEFVNQLDMVRHDLCHVLRIPELTALSPWATPITCLLFVVAALRTHKQVAPPVASMSAELVDLKFGELVGLASTAVSYLKDVDLTTSRDHFLVMNCLNLSPVLNILEEEDPTFIRLYESALVWGLVSLSKPLTASGKIEPYTTCRYLAECPTWSSGSCHHTGAYHRVSFSCGTARAAALTTPS